jgi:hypothetical protein
MPRGPRGEKRPADVIGAAVMVANIATASVSSLRRCRRRRIVALKLTAFPPSSSAPCFPECLLDHRIEIHAKAEQARLEVQDVVYITQR